MSEVSDIIQCGAKRLQHRIRTEHPLAVNIPLLNQIIIDDPGIQALVEFARDVEAYPHNIWVERAAAALSRWERGESC